MERKSFGRTEVKFLVTVINLATGLSWLKMRWIDEIVDKVLPAGGSTLLRDAQNQEV